MALSQVRGSKRFVEAARVAHAFGFDASIYEQNTWHESRNAKPVRPLLDMSREVNRD